MKLPKTIYFRNLYTNLLIGPSKNFSIGPNFSFFSAVDDSGPSEAVFSWLSSSFWFRLQVFSETYFDLFLRDLHLKQQMQASSMYSSQIIAAGGINITTKKKLTGMMTPENIPKVLMGNNGLKMLAKNATEVVLDVIAIALAELLNA